MYKATALTKLLLALQKDFDDNYKKKSSKANPEHEENLEEVEELIPSNQSFAEAESETDSEYDAITSQYKTKLQNLLKELNRNSFPSNISYEEI